MSAVTGQRLGRMLLALAAVSALAGALWVLVRLPLAEHFADYYGNWRDALLAQRIDRAPGFFFAFAVAAAIGAGVVPWAWRFDRVAESDLVDRWSSPGLLLAAVGLGITVSWSQWQAYGMPCWDGYCDRAALWADWFADPTAAGLAELFAAIRRFHTGASVLPPLFIGLLAATGLPVVAAFFVANLLAWTAVGLLAVAIARRHLALSPAATATALVLLFGHLAVQRSMIFPQTDPLALAAILAVLHALLNACREPGVGHGAVLFVALLAALATKLSCAPMLAAAPLAVLLGVGRSKATQHGRLVEAIAAGVVFSIGPLLVWLGILHGLGLLPALLAELGFVAGRESAIADFYADNNPLRLLVAGLATFQLAPLLLFSSGFRRAVAEQPVLRLIAGLVMLFIVALVAMRTAFWLRYFLPVVPLVALLAAAPLVAAVPGAASRAVLLAVYLAGNTLFVARGLYY